MSVCDALVIVLFLALIYLICMLIKVENASKNQEKILNAIDAYAQTTGDYETALMALFVMEDFEETIYRLWDWGYKNILPNAYYELIESYIQ